VRPAHRPAPRGGAALREVERRVRLSSVLRAYSDGCAARIASASARAGEVARLAAVGAALAPAADVEAGARTADARHEFGPAVRAATVCARVERLAWQGHQSPPVVAWSFTGRQTARRESAAVKRSGPEVVDSRAAGRSLRPTTRPRGVEADAARAHRWHPIAASTPRSRVKSRVEPSMSLNRNVTVPLGRSARTRSYAQSPRHVKCARTATRTPPLSPRPPSPAWRCTNSVLHFDDGSSLGASFDRPLAAEMDEQARRSNTALPDEAGVFGPIQLTRRGTTCERGIRARANGRNLGQSGSKAAGPSCTCCSSFAQTSVRPSGAPASASMR
jgi:hypothetical protein